MLTGSRSNNSLLRESDDDCVSVTDPVGGTPHSNTAIDLLHAVNGVESHHGISTSRGLRGSNPHSAGTRDTLAKRSFSPTYRAVARSNTPHRQPCHRRVRNRPRSSPPLVYSGTASHGCRRSAVTVRHKLHDCGGKSSQPRYSWIGSRGLPLDPRLKTGGCANTLYHSAFISNGALMILIPDMNVTRENGTVRTV